MRRELSAVTPLELRPETLRLYSTRGSSTLGEHGENFAGAVADLVKKSQREPRSAAEEGVRSLAQTRLDAVLPWIDQVTPRGIGRIATQSAPTGEVVFAVQEAPFERLILAPSLSDGTLRFTALAFAAIDPDPGQKTLVIEELENGVNPSRLPLLVQMLDQVTGEGASTQVIASTHSPAVLDAAPPRVIESCVVVGWEDDEAHSVVRRLRDLPGIDSIVTEGGVPLGELQAEGWINAAVSA